MLRIGSRQMLRIGSRQPAGAGGAVTRLLSTTDHDRGVAGLRYVYAVVSRRAGGVSIGINLNPNNACNYRCVYCQVPDLVAGRAPAIDRDRLQTELDTFLGDVVEGGWLERHAPAGSREVRDVAFSGNGEPTSARGFAQIVDLVAASLARRGLLERVPLRLITNGSLCHRPTVRDGLERLAAYGGEVWLKVDSVTRAGMARINGAPGAAKRLRANVEACARRCPTWLQSCVFSVDGSGPGEDELGAYLDFVAGLVTDGVPVRGVLLYTMARPSMQPEAPRLAALDDDAMARIAARIEALGVSCRR